MTRGKKVKNSQKYLTDEQIEKMVECLMYVRDDNKATIGMVVLTQSGDFGWSLFDEKLEPNGSMDKGKGILIACSRAEPFLLVRTDLNLRASTREEYGRVIRLMGVWEVLSRVSDWAESKSGKEEE